MEQQSFSFEFFPPKTEKGIESLIKVRSTLAELNPDFFSVTYGAGGSTQDSTFKTVLDTQKETGISTAPHLSCVGSSKEQISDILTGYKNNGINRIVALRGDLPSGMQDIGELQYANELVEYIRKVTGDHFQIEVAAYPEMHPQATTYQSDIENFAKKMNAGADRAITQYFYNSSQEQIIYHRLSQRISYSKNAQRYGELENELDYKLTSYLSFYNNMFYNYKQNKFSKLFNKATYNHEGVRLSLSHLFKDNFLPKTADNLRYTSYLTTGATYKYNRHYSYMAAYNYDLETKEKKSFSVGFLYKKRCWDFGIKYSENNRPVLTNAATKKSSVYDKYIYFTIVLKPLMKPTAGDSLLSYKLAN